MKCIADAWSAHQTELLRFVESRLNSHKEAHDTVQEVFLKALKQPDGLCSVANRRAWLFRVARNILIDRYRLTKDQVPLDEDFAGEPESEGSAVDALAQCLTRVLSELSAQDRQAIMLCDIEGVTQQSFALLSGLTLPAAKARVQRARVRLRAQLIESCQVSFDERGKVCCYVPRAQTQR